MYLFFYNTVIGKIGISEKDGCIQGLYFDLEETQAESIIVETPLLKEAAHQLEAYLSGKLKVFSLPLKPEGSPFMMSIWDLLNKIPYGEKATYGQLALQQGNAKAARAVGLACNRNPIPIFIPCHRVIGASGALTGYRGGLPLKFKLLSLEGIQFKMQL